jgi:hypothetical protein
MLFSVVSGGPWLTCVAQSSMPTAIPSPTTRGIVSRGALMPAASQTVLQNSRNVTLWFPRM